MRKRFVLLTCVVVLVVLVILAVGYFLPARMTGKVVATTPNLIINQINVYSPSVLYDPQENLYKMWYSGWILENQVNDNIYYAESLDGEDWSFKGTALRNGESGSYDDIHVGDPAVVKFRNGVTGIYQYYMFYTTASSRCLMPNCYGTIALAVSNDGLNWTKIGRVIVPNLDNTYLNLNYEEQQKTLKIDGLIGVSTPSVLYEDNKFKVYFNVHHLAGYNDVGMAESDSPWFNSFVLNTIINKDFPNYPSTNYKFFLSGGGISNPEILKLENSYLLLYDYFDNSRYKIGMAYSYDEQNWVDYSQNPLVMSTGNNLHAISPFGLKNNESQIRLYYAMTENQNLLFEKIYLRLINFYIPPTQPSTPTCTSLTYSPWSQCNSSALQSRTITSSNPLGCTGGTPESLLRQCSPPCLESNWQETNSSCLSSNTLTRTWTKIGNCNQTIGISKSASETVSCTYIPNAITCMNFTYSNWSECFSNGVQNRSPITHSPTNCSGGNPILTQSCDYTIQIDNPLENEESSSETPSTNSDNSDNDNANAEELLISPPENLEDMQQAEDYKEPSFLRKFFCKLINLFNQEKYSKCVSNS
jgi:predicted GH43/DUF377 family glycosyl hydrolase